MSDLYQSVDIISFRNATRDITFDVFLKLSDNNYAHVFSRTTGLDYKRLAQYIQKGVRQLYIRRADQQAYEQFVTKTADSIFHDPNVPNEKKIASLLNMTEQNMSEIFALARVPEATAKNAQKVVKNYVNLMVENPKSLAVILKLVSHGDFLYYHSIATAIFSMFMAKASGQYNTRTLELVGMGGFLHDIGSTKLPKELVCAADDLQGTELYKMREHPKLGLEMVEKTPNVPDEVRYIIYQHHEQPGGGGFPNQIRGPVIYHPAKLVAIADAFSGLISKRPNRPAFTPEQAIALMRREAGKYDRDLLNLLASIFLRGSSQGSGGKAA
ncbi:MAG: HD domain-containing protein [Bdellovibrionales bacterium]|nr:HD domain-containing protein [Bdellovibrionales bacterium]